jgi:uncharacterized protein (TIGR02466 family)
MQEVVDSIQEQREISIIRPFGPTIIKGKIPTMVQQQLCKIFEHAFDADDHSLFLAGNMKREFTLNETAFGNEDAQPFVQMLADGSADVYRESKQLQWLNTRDVVTDAHRELVDARIDDMNLSCVIHEAWGNISVAGDWNPIHSHTGAISGVGYLRLPDTIEHEWSQEDHDPSAAMIQFTDGRPANLNMHNVRMKPAVGDIYFFPAWLLHEVYPFRSTGERWSFSFNTTVENLNQDMTLTDTDKEMIRGAS